MTRTRLTLIALAVMALALTCLVLVPTPSSYAAGRSCQGMPATLVGTPGSTIRGTDGPDVVVTGGAAAVDTLAGDDLVCLTSGRTGPDPTGTEPTVRTGPDSDTVLGYPPAQSVGFVHVDLGTGPDRFTASQDVVDGLVANYVVDTGDPQESQESRMSALPHDVVVGGAGDDDIRSGVRDLADDDDLDGGGGFDQVTVRGTPTGRLDGGPGDQGDTLLLRTTAPAVWVIDAAGGASVDGAPIEQRSFDAYDVTGLAWSRLRFVGTPGPDILTAGYADGSGGSRAPLVADLGSGGDEVDLSTRTPATIRAGGGRDAVYLYEEHRSSPRLRSRNIRTDLTQGWSYVDHATPNRLVSIEHFASFGFGTTTVAGTASADDLYVDGCRARVYARAGDDVVHFQHASHCPGRSDRDSRRRQRGLDAYGNAGDDYLYGSTGVDHLQGGPGRDYGTGGSGADTCYLVESAVSCRRL